MLKFNVIVILLLCACVSSQEKSAGKRKETPHTVPTFEVKFEPDPKLETSFREDDTGITSDGCDDRGNPYVQVHRHSLLNGDEVLKFDEKGIVTFETNKISDLVEPKWMADFASDSELYMLIEGNTHWEQRSEKSDDGQEGVYWKITGEPRYYITRFDADGSYKGALKLDLPFRPEQFSGFASGNFLVAGIDADFKPRLVLLDSSGQMLRNIEFAKEGQKEKQEAAEWTVMRSFYEELEEYPEDIGEARALARLTSFFPYQNDVLYFRGRTGEPIYRITAGGEVSPVKIKSEEGYSVNYILPSDRNWFVVPTESGKDAKSIVDELSPARREVIAHYLVEGAGREVSGPFDVTCFHDGQFVAVRVQEGKLTVLHGVPTPAGKNTPTIN